MTNSPQASWKAYEEGAFYTTHLKGGHHPEVCVCGGGGVCKRDEYEAMWGEGLFKEGTPRTGKTEGPYPQAS